MSKKEFPYGLCPICGGHGINRERRPNGNDKCENGHTYLSKEAIPPLEPVDTEQCQTEKQSYNAFIMGGSCYTTVRCEEKPVFVATEKKPDEHGQTGAMSLCAKHFLIFRGQLPDHEENYVVQTVNQWKDDQAQGLVKVG